MKLEVASRKPERPSATFWNSLRCTEYFEPLAIFDNVLPALGAAFDVYQFLIVGADDSLPSPILFMAGKDGSNLIENLVAVCVTAVNTSDFL